MQVDWISAMTETPPTLWPGYTTGERITLDPRGRLLDRRASMHRVDDGEPSSSRNFTVWTPGPGALYLSGNPVKLLQGHNLWGSDDLLALYLEAGLFVRHHGGMFPGPQSWEACKFSRPRFTRIDLTRSYRFQTQAEADDYIRFVAGNARSRHGAATLVGGSTAYFGQHSRRWTMKIYAKFHELTNEVRKYSRRKVRFLNPFGGVKADLYHWAEGVARFELTLRSPELEDINDPRLGFQPLQSQHLLDVWQHYFDRITMTENSIMNTASPLLEATLPGRLHGALALWRSGRDLRQVYPRNTFYRYRLEILEKTGIDVSVPQALDAPQNVRTELDPARWDPEPLEAHTVLPRDELKAQYKLV